MRLGVAWVLAIPLASGCVHRVGKFVAPEAYVVPAVGDRVAQVRYTSGFADDPERAFDPEPFREGWSRPVAITETGAISVRPPEGAEVEVWLRHPGVGGGPFQPVIARTGGLDKAIPNELRIGWAPVAGQVRIPISDLSNVYAGNPAWDGDLLLVRVDGVGPAEDYLFRIRRFGLRGRVGAGVLVRVPVPGVDGQRPKQVTPSSTLALSVAVGYRPRTQNPVVYWTTEQVALVASLGVGSTRLQRIQASVGDPVNTQIEGAFNAAITGLGVEFFHFVSLQGQVNLSSFLRDARETPWAVAVGFDAVQFARLTRSALTRLFAANRLEPEPPEPEP